VGAGGVWIGGLFVLMLAGLPACHVAEAEVRSSARRLLVGLFSSRALIAAPLTVGFGAWLGVQYLGWSWPLTLFDSSYGGALAVKVALVIAIAVLGARNWRYVQPRLEQPEGERLFRRTGGAEVLLSVLLLGVTAVLVALSFAEHGS
jgi:putative copper export protein